MKKEVNLNNLDSWRKILTIYLCLYHRLKNSRAWPCFTPNKHVGPRFEYGIGSNFNNNNSIY